MKLYTSIDLAYWFLNKVAASKESLPEMTQMKLQKFVYFSQIVAVSTGDGARIHCDNTYAWDYGPVEPRLFGVTKKFKGNPLNITLDPVLKESFTKHSPENIADPDALEIVDAVWDKFKNWSPERMMILAHKRGCAWERVFYGRQKYDIITPADMRAYGFGF